MSHKSYTSKSKRERFTFDIDGEPFAALGAVPLLDLADFADVQDLKADSIEAVGLIARFFKMLLGEAEYERFRTYCREHSVDPDVQLEILSDCFVAVVGPPSERPSASSDGPTSTPHTSQVISFSNGSVIRELTPAEETALLAELENDRAS